MLLTILAKNEAENVFDSILRLLRREMEKWSGERKSRTAYNYPALPFFCWSGRGDSNARPPAPKAGALTRLRYAPNGGCHIGEGTPILRRSPLYSGIGKTATFFYNLLFPVVITAGTCENFSISYSEER